MAEKVKTGGDCGSASPDATDSFLSEDYECKICYNYFDLERHTPKTLGCSHTFCQECLDALHSRGGRGWRIGCPVCRHRTPVPEYRVPNLPDNTAVTAALRACEPVNASNRGAQTVPVMAQEDGESCHSCKLVAFATGCACNVFSVLSMVVLLYLGLIFVHNFNNSMASYGRVCLFVACVLALLSLILTWLTLLLR